MDLSSKSGTLRPLQIPVTPAVSISFPSNPFTKSSLVFHSSSCPSQEWSLPHIPTARENRPHFFLLMCTPTQTMLASFLSGLFSSSHCLILMEDFWPFHMCLSLLCSCLCSERSAKPLHHLVQGDAGYTVCLVRAPGWDAPPQKRAKPAPWMHKWLSSSANRTSSFHLEHGMETDYTCLTVKPQEHPDLFCCCHSDLS